MENIIVALIAGGMSLIGVIITNITSNKSIEAKLMVAQGITDTKIDNLTQEVKRHNSFTDKIPRLETRLDAVENRLNKLEDDGR